MNTIAKINPFFLLLSLCFCFSFSLSPSLSPSLFAQSPTEDFFSARWITSSVDAGLPLFRKSIKLQKPLSEIASAKAFVCGLGHYQLDVNGQPVSAPLSPGWTNYNKTCLYNIWDVKPQLRNGENVLGVWLGNGFFNVQGGRYVKFTRSFGKPQFILRIEIEYKNGEKQTIASDDSWKTTTGPIRFSCVYGGEDWLVTLQLDGWETPEFDDSSWGKADYSQNIPCGQLQMQTHPNIAVIETLSPETITVLPNGTIEADFGYNFSGRPRLKVIGKPGKKIVITLAERQGLPWSGHSYTIEFADDFDVKTNPVLILPHFTYWGFQYMYISGVQLASSTPSEENAPVLENIQAEFLSSSSRQVGQFHSTAAWLEDVENMIQRSVRSNLQHVLTDCPHREKLGWLEVAHLMGPSIAYRLDIQELYRKICQDITEAQLPSGMVPDIAPEYTRFSNGFFESAEWSSATVQIPWLLYRFYEDRQTLEKQYPTMEKYMSYFASTRNARGLAKAGLGDWYDWSPQRGHAGYSQHTPGELTATAFLINNAQIMNRVCTILGKPEDAKRYADLAQTATQDFLKAYYNSETGVVAQQSQAAYAFALGFHLIPETDRSKVMIKFIESIEKTGYRPTTGEVAFVFMLRTLMEENRDDVISKIIMRESSPGYVNMLVNHHMKTLSETWDGPGSSMNHCMFGHAQEWFVAGLLGIRQTDTSNGFKELLLAPHPSKEILNAKGYFESRYGRITSDWNVLNGNFVWRFTIPSGSTGIVCVPVIDEQTKVEFADKVSRLSRYKEGVRIYNLPAGEYKLNSDWQPR